MASTVKKWQGPVGWSRNKVIVVGGEISTEDGMFVSPENTHIKS